MKTIGILGGGQLGMMLAEEIYNLGGQAICLDPNPKCPASFVCDVIPSSYNDINGIRQLGDRSDVLTYEFENIPAELLEFMITTYLIPQGVKPLYDSQNRIREKQNAIKFGLRTPRFKAIYCFDDLLIGVKEIGFPCVYKTASMGYDGHGQVVLHSASDLELVKDFLPGEGVLEEFISFEFETSIILIRSKSQMITFPMTYNVHKKGILDLCIANESPIIFERIEEASKRFMKSADYYGILTIEFFVKGNEFYFNEMAPRPHNSGHWTIEGCTTNQYREFAKFLLDIPLEEPKRLFPVVMKNILGKDMINIAKVAHKQNIYLHLYHKEKASLNRKMGHVTFAPCTYLEYQEKYENTFCKE